MPKESEVLGLTALMLLHDSRRSARVASDGSLVTLEEQDRSLWDREQIAEGLGLVDRAIRLGRPGPYQIQAAIGALHARSERAEDTDWRQIALLYEKLVALTGSPVVELNHAVALAMAHGPELGLEKLEELDRRGELSAYHLFHAARADLLRRAKQFPQALGAYDIALTFAKNAREREYLERRRKEVLLALDCGSG
jgi:RNA polymerase sigma-70 factor (ECF subfamily)